MSLQTWIALLFFLVTPRQALAADPLPDRLVGYGVVNFWQTIDPNELASQLARHGLNFTSMEYVPGEWYQNQVREPDPEKAVSRAKAKAFVAAMRAKGIWTHINLINWNGKKQRALPTSWFRGELAWIQANIGTDRVMLQAVSEWDDRDAKAKEWAEIVAKEWMDIKSSNRGTRPKSVPTGHLLEYHPCAPSDRRWPRGRTTLVNTDCGQIIKYLNGGKQGGADTPRIKEYVRDVLLTDAHFHYYGFEDRQINTKAIEAIAEGVRLFNSTRARSKRNSTGSTSGPLIRQVGSRRYDVRFGIDPP